MKNYNYLLLIIAFILSSCGVTTSIVDTSCQKYKSDSFSKAMITQKGIGILTVLGADDRPGLTRITTEALNRNMKLAYGNTPVKATTEVLSKMFENNLSQEYNAALIKYATTDSLSKKVLEQLGQTLSVNYIMTSRLGNDQQYNYLDINNQNKGNAAIDEMFLQSQVWDTKTGQVVWEGMGGVAALKSYPINVVEHTTAGLAKVLAQNNEKKEVYDSYNQKYKNVTAPCQTKEEIINTHENQIIKTISYLPLIFLGFIIIIFIASGGSLFHL
jgi:hypothetical protein